MRKINHQSDSVQQIKKLLPSVLNKLFAAPIEKYKWGKAIWLDEDQCQKVECRYNRLPDIVSTIFPLRKQDFVAHFSRKTITADITPDMEEHYTPVGWELCVDLSDRETTHIKSLCLWVYGDDRKQITEKLLPKLDEYGIEYLIHRVGFQLRFWMFCDTSIALVRLFINTILRNTDITDLIEFGLINVEICPLAEFSGPIGIPGGYGDSVEFRGTTSKSPIFAMKSIIECKPVSEMQMLAIAGQQIKRKKTVNDG